MKFCGLFKVLLVSILLTFMGAGQALHAQYYPVHVTVQWPSPQSPYLSDYYSGSRDRLIITLLNRDLQQPLLFARLRIKIKSTGFLASSRQEVSYPILELNANVPTRLTNIDLAPYLQPQNLQTSGRLINGQLPVGFTEFSVQVIDYYTGRALSDWHTGRSYLDVKKPPLLNFPEKDAQIGITEPLYIRFQWMPRHQGLAGTEYEFVLKELPDNGVAPQSAFAYGNEIYRVRTRNTTLNYTHLEPVLFPNRCYAWQVQAITRDGVDEVGMFENGGFSEINWFYLNDNCQAPTGLKALPRFANVELSWNKVMGTTGYVVECRPKTKLNVYEWSRTRVAGEHITLAQLKPGWTYEWRVGTLCTDDRPVLSDVHEFTLSSQNDELLADCGKEPVRSDLSQEPNLRIKAGDIVTIGGDYPMTIIEAVSLGDGWYSGRGKTRLKTIIDTPVSLRFDRLRINVDKFQIDGTVEASYDEKKGKTANLDYIDDGGKDVKPSTLRIREHKLDFTLPDIPEIVYNPETGELEFTDSDGNPHTIQLNIPENGSYESIFPMTVTDDKGNSYQVRPTGEKTEEESGNDTKSKIKQDKIQLIAERVARVGDFNTDVLSDKHGYVRFERGEGKYAFDNGKEKWYKKSVKTDRFYKPFAKGYIAPWKLVPTGENDIVTARYDGLKNIDLKKVRFVSEPNSAALPAKLNETEQTWTVTLQSVPAGTSYDVFAVYEGAVIGKLRVVSYAKQQHKVTLVPINKVRLDKAAIEQELNAIYNPVGVQFTVHVDESMRGNYDWEVDSEKDGLLSLVGKSFWGYDKELKESTEMLNLQKAYQQHAGTLDGAYLFVLNGAMGLEGQKNSLLGEMPRKSRFGYIFAGNSPNTNTSSLAHTIAHEVGHGILTLQHTFDAEYGKGTQGTTSNLLDYTETGKDLAAFQWNVMANPAVFTGRDKANEGKIVKTGYYIKNNSGIAPNGRVINSCESSKYGVVSLILQEEPYYIHGFILYNIQDGSIVKEYNWDGTTYASSGKAIEQSTDVTLTYSNATSNVTTKIYKTEGDKCYYNYATISYNPVKKEIPKEPIWHKSYLWHADESCMACFINDILTNDNNDCDESKIVEDKKQLASINANTKPERIVDIILPCCINSLKTLSYEKLTELFVRVASQEKLKEESEITILRLMNALNGADYARFYNLLEANNNKLLIHLVDQMDDASGKFWSDKRNYTSFIGALIWMFNSNNGTSIIDRLPLNTDDYAQRVINLEPIPYDKFEVYGLGYTHRSTKHNDGKYDESTGNIELYDVYTHYNTGQLPENPGIETKAEQKDHITTVSPLTPILIVPNTEKLPLVETALGENVLSNQMYVVPAIFLKYNHDKIRNDYIEKGIVTTLDVATILLSGGTALATKVHWVRRAWALAEVVGAAGNIAVNTQVVSSPRVKEAVDIYNSVMGLIGIKNIGQGGYKFVKNLPEQTKGLLQKNKRLRDRLRQEYLKWKALANNLGNIADTDKRLINEQEQIWRILGITDHLSTLFDITKLKKLTPRIPTGKNLTNLKIEDFTQLLSKSEMKRLGDSFAQKLDNIIKKGDNSGNITEEILSEVFRKQGYIVTKDIGKYGSNNGFDIVAYKGSLDTPTEILIIECKQMKQKIISEFDDIVNKVGYDKASGLVLNKANPETGLPTQMSMEWTFDHVRLELLKKGGIQKDLSNSIKVNSKKVERYIFAIDKSDGTGYFTKLSNDF